MSRVRTTILAIFAALMLAMLALAGVASAQQSGAAGGAHPTALFAWAKITDADGDRIGGAVFVQKRDSEKVKVFVAATGLEPGRHGIHIHSVGRCDPNAVDPATGSPFFSAGTHFNPEEKEHGLHNPDGPHAGDLPNLKVGPGGVGFLRAKNDRITLREGPENSLFDADGSSIVIHADRDDQVTDPTGNSGVRVACGVIRKAR
jgi:Cu-Zn family superoxide dismutase